MRIIHIAACITVFCLLTAVPSAYSQTEATRVESTDVRVRLNTPLGEKREVGTLNEYIATVYQYAGPFIFSIAVIAIMIAGVLWLTSGGDAPRISAAKTTMVSAVTGIVLYLLSYTILNLINPDLVKLQELTGITTIDRIDFEITEDIPLDRIPNAPALTQIQGANMIVAASDPRISAELLPSVQTAARTLQSQGYNLIVSSAFRDPAQQQALIEKNCTGVSCENFTCMVTGSCNPPTCKLTNGPQSCPHTTGRAIDVWGAKDGAQCIRLNDCIADKEACAQNPCQKAAIDAMRAQGFCRLCAEPWHFEKPKMSSCCN